MTEDVLGNEVGNATPEAQSGINNFIEGFLGYETRAENVSAAAMADPDSALAQIYAALIALFRGTRTGVKEAQTWLDKAEQSSGDAPERVQMNLAMVTALAIGDIPQALRIGDEIVDAHPTDLVAMKLHQNINFNRGNAPEMLRIARKVLPHNADNPHVHGMLAFGYEECHFLDKAEVSAQRALELKSKEPWAQHALAHVMLTRGQVPEGRAFLTDVSSTWEGLNSFMYTHNWWHAALFDISLGDFDAVFAAYDRHCWGIDKDFAEDQIGAVSLLARMEFAGLDVGDRWQDVAERLKPRADDTLQPFTTMQYLYGLAKAELAEADKLMAAVTERAANATPFEKLAWAGVAKPACRGLLAHARGDHAAAVDALSFAMPRMMEIGGSHAQRDLFAQVLLDAHIKCGHYATAQQMLESRRAYDPNGVPLNRMLAGIYEKLGLLEEADEARARHY